jgi:hypothetical protein
VLYFDLRTNQLSRSFVAYPQGEYAIGAIAYSDDGQRVATGKYPNFDGARIDGVWVERKHSLTEANVWDAHSGKMLASLAGEPVPGDMSAGDAPIVRALLWTRSYLAICDDLSVRFWQITAKSSRLVRSDDVSHGCYSLASSSSGIIAAAHDDRVEIYK